MPMRVVLDADLPLEGSVREAEERGTSVDGMVLSELSCAAAKAHEAPPHAGA